MTNSLIPEMVEAIADAKDSEPGELDIALHRHIELDAIQLLVSHENASWKLEFELPNHDVAVTSDGLVEVDGEYDRVWTSSSSD